MGVESDMQNMRLTYFDARGRAETARLILAYGGLDYQDRRIPIGKGRCHLIHQNYTPSTENESK